MLCAKVAAIVRACSFVITAELAPNDIPFGGDGMVTCILSIVERGSSDDLDAHRCGVHSTVVPGAIPMLSALRFKCLLACCIARLGLASKLHWLADTAVAERPDRLIVGSARQSRR